MFEFSTELKTAPEKALDRARAIFTYGGLEVAGAGHNELALKGPGMNLKQNNILSSIKTGTLTISGGRVQIGAEFSMRFMKIVLYIPALLLLAVAAGIYFSGLYKQDMANFVTQIVVAVLLFIIAPAMSIYIRRKIEADIKRAIASIAME